MNGSHMIEGRRSVRRTLRSHTTVAGKRGLTNRVATDISGTGFGLQWCIEGPAPRTCKERWRVCPPLVPAESSAGPCVTTLSLAVCASLCERDPSPTRLIQAGVNVYIMQKLERWKTIPMHKAWPHPA